MPELGKYAFAVLTSYGVTIALLAGVVLLSLWQGARMRRALAEVEARAAEAVDG
ncbi:heme exporter protein CcmD [Fuscovulum blasticum]|uniref:heme exporter protein CcmD n=1 Tax=Fuscovulum blasticum TaxID=1075 RepID=UPI003AAB2284